MPGLAVLVVLALASYRLAHLVAADSITLPLRDNLHAWVWVETGVDDHGHPVYEPRAGAWRTYVYELLTCQWCLGVWAAIGAYCAWRWGGDVARAVLVVAAIAGAQGFLASRAES